MYDELVERLHKRIALTTAGSPLQDDLLEAADAIEELSKLNKKITERELKLRMEKPRWISVEEALPEPFVEVLLYSGEDRYIGYMYNDKRFIVNAPHYPGRPTHWAHLLPEPPKEETE